MLTVGILFLFGVVQYTMGQYQSNQITDETNDRNEVMFTFCLAASVKCVENKLSASTVKVAEM